MERENSSNNLKPKPRRYVPSNNERVNGTSNNEDSCDDDDDDDDDVAGEYLEVKDQKIGLLLLRYRI